MHDPRVKRILDLIKAVGGFDEDLEYLNAASIQFKEPWMWPTARCTTYSQTCIRLSLQFFKWDANEQAQILCHESIHCKQYKDGRLTWAKYLNPFSTIVKSKVEMEAGQEESRWHAAWKAWSRMYPNEAKMYT